MIDRLCDEAGGEDIAVAGFYCDFRYQDEQTAANIMGAILKQLVAKEEILGHVQMAFQKAQKELGGRDLRLPDMVQMVKRAVATLPQVFICIDGLDECLPKHLLELLGSLKDILRESPGTRVFATGRPHVEVDIVRYFAAGIIVPIRPGTREIKRYLEKKLEMDTMRDAMSDDLRVDILRIIPERISEMCVGASTIPAPCMILYLLTIVCRFLLVSLNIDAILGEVTIFDRRQKLNEITKGNHLDDAYATTLARVKAQKGGRSRLGMEALMWVSNSERPLDTSELCHALGVKIGSPDLSIESIPTIGTLLACSLGLITVEASSSTVRLVHFSLQEYLSDNPSLFQSPHTMIAEVCLTYLNFQCVREPSTTLTSAPQTAPLALYASCCWGKHIRREKVEIVSPLALALLIQFEEHISSQLLFLQYQKDKGSWETSFDGRGGPNGFTGLHGAASFGMMEIVVALLAMKEWDINATDCMGRTALAWAAVGGHEDVVRILLQHNGAKADTADTQYGRTPLSLAAGSGHEGVVKLLLEQEDVNPNIADTEYGRTPLSWAAGLGREGVVKFLLEREDINLNAADTLYGRTPLLWAAERGHGGVVKLLLEREDINLNTADTVSGQTPLLWAVNNRHERIVKSLLKREDINPNIADTFHGRAPLFCAAKNGDAGVVKLLLEREDTNPNTADTGYGQTPLLWAVKNGDEGVVKLLLEREDTNPDTADTFHGRTPLSWAVESGREGVVALLLGREDINISSLGTQYCRNPLLWAVERGRKGVVELLLGRINLNTMNTESAQWLLFSAARAGNLGVVKLILEREDVNFNTMDRLSDQTPLSFAAQYGREDVVKLLLERVDIGPRATDTNYGQTPLSLAARNGHSGVVKLLLEREDIDPNAVGTKSGERICLRAMNYEYLIVLDYRLGREDIDFNTATDEYDLTPLSHAAMGGHEGVVKLLLEREDIDFNAAVVGCGLTPLMLAAMYGREGVVKLLLEREDINPNTADTLYGQTPRLWAARNGYEGIVKLLLEREDAGPDGKMALILAVPHGHARVMELLSPQKPSLSLSVDIDEVPQHVSPHPSDLLHSPSQSIPVVCPSTKSLPPSPPPLLRMAIGSFMIISLIFLFYFLPVISPSLSAILLLPFHR